MNIVNLATIALIIMLTYVATSNIIKNILLKAELKGSYNASMRQQEYTRHDEDDSYTSSQSHILLWIFVLCIIFLFVYIGIGLA